MKNLILLFLLATVTFSYAQTPTSSFTYTPSPFCLGQPITVTYTGNATAAATYNWDFGSAYVILGTGQGPYIIQWNVIGSSYISLSVIDYPDTSVTTTQLLEVVPCMGIENIENSNLSITPNPAIDNICIKTSLSNTVAEIFDINGKILLKEYISGDQQLDISKFDKAVYVVKLTSDKKTYFKTLIKE